MQAEDVFDRLRALFESAPAKQRERQTLIVDGEHSLPKELLNSLREDEYEHSLHKPNIKVLKPTLSEEVKQWNAQVDEKKRLKRMRNQ